MEDLKYPNSLYCQICGKYHKTEGHASFESSEVAHEKKREFEKKTGFTIYPNGWENGFTFNYLNDGEKRPRMNLHIKSYDPYADSGDDMAVSYNDVIQISEGAESWKKQKDGIKNRIAENEVKINELRDKAGVTNDDSEKSYLKGMALLGERETIALKERFAYMEYAENFFTNFMSDKQKKELIEYDEWCLSEREKGVINNPWGGF